MKNKISHNLNRLALYKKDVVQNKEKSCFARREDDPSL